MAAAAVITAAIPLVVRLADKLLGSKTGPDKLNTAMSITSAIQQGLQNTKALVGQPLNGDEMRALIEAAVSDLNSRGQLKGLATVLDAAAAAPGHVASMLESFAAILRGAQ